MAEKIPEKHATRKRGFTLIEVLVATMIMLVIVMSLSAVFKQMTAAWGVGMRKIKTNMEGRAAMDHMAQELALAVADGKLEADLGDNSTVIRFFTIDSHTPTNRLVRRIKYRKIGRNLERTVWPVQWDCGGDYPSCAAGASYSHNLVGSVNELHFYTSDGQTHTTNLPDWVDIEMQLDQNSRVSRAAVGSAGPDETWNTADDIVSE